MGAAASLLMARMCLAARQPTMCWMAPLIPTLERRRLEQAATPALARDGERITRRDLGAVGGHRQRHARTNVGHHLAASVARRPDDDLGVELVGQIGECMPPGSWRVLR